MSRPPDLTDRTALKRNRARAARAPALFLQEDAASEIQERLNEVNRTFTAPAIVTDFPDFWAAAFPAAKIIFAEETLDLEAGAHDLVIHSFALHWANDPVGQLIQCRHALRADGLFMGVLFGGQTLSELRAALAEAETRVTGGLSPRILPMADIRDLGALLQRAGFALPVADGAMRTVSYRDALHLMRDLRAMGETNALSQRLRHPTRRAVMGEATRIYAENFPATDSEQRIRATFELVFLTGWAPDESQQQPLRPGSARARLADALRTDEQPLRDPATKGGI